MDSTGIITEGDRLPLLTDLYLACWQRFAGTVYCGRISCVAD